MAGGYFIVDGGKDGEGGGGSGGGGDGGGGSQGGGNVGEGTTATGKTQSQNIQQTMLNVQLIEGGATPTMGGWVSQSGEVIGKTTQEAAENVGLRQFETQEQLPRNQFIAQMQQNEENKSALAASYQADLNLISRSIGAQVNPTSKAGQEVLAKYQEARTFREKRSEQVIRGTSKQEGAMGKTGADVVYPTGFFSPMNVEATEAAIKSGKSGIILMTGEPRPTPIVGAATNPQGEFSPFIPLGKITEGNNLVSIKEGKETFSAQGAPVFGGYSSLAGYEVVLTERAPLVSMEPTKPEYGYSAYTPPSRGKAEAVIFSPREQYTTYTGETTVPVRQEIGYSIMPKEDIPQKVLGGMSIRQFQEELAYTPIAKQFGTTTQNIRTLVNTPGSKISTERGEILSSYSWVDAEGKPTVRFSQPIRDYSILPATPTERTKAAIKPFETAASTANTGDIVGVFLPSVSLGSKIVSTTSPQVQKIEYKSSAFRASGDLALAFPGMVVSETAKTTLGSYYRLAPVEFKTQEQLETFKASPQKQEAYRKLAASQLEGGRSESAVNIATVYAFEIAGAAAPLVRGSQAVSKLAPFAFKPYVPEEAGLAYARSSIARGEGREGIFNPVFVEKGKVIQYIPEKRGVVEGESILSGFRRVGSDIITERPTAITTRVVSSKEIDKLPQVIGTERGLFTDITEGAQVKIKRTATVYEKEGITFGSGTSGYSIRGEIYEQKGVITSSAGELATIKQNILFVPKKGSAEFFKFTTTGTAQTSMSIPIEGFAVGKSYASATKLSPTTYKTSRVNVFSTGNVLGVKEIDAGYSIASANIPLSQSGFRTFGIVKTEVGKPTAITEYFSKNQPKTIELMPEPKATTLATKRVGMKPLQVQIQDQPLISKFVPETRTQQPSQIQRSITQPTTLAGFSIQDYDKPIQSETYRTSGGVKFASLGGQIPAGRTDQPTATKFYSPIPTALKGYQVPSQKFSQNEPSIKEFGGIQIKIYSPVDEGVKDIQSTAQKQYTATQTTQKLYGGGPSFTTPYVDNTYKRQVPPPKIRIGGGFDIFPDMSGTSGIGGRYKRQKGRYQPSFIALSLGIKAKKGEAAKTEKFGFAVRPIVEGKKKK